MSLMDQVDYAPVPGGSQRLAVSATGARTALIAAIKKMGWIRCYAKGADIDVNFGSVTDTIPVVDSVTDDGTIGYTIVAGTYHDFWINGAHTHVLWDATAAGFLMITRAGQERVRTE